MFEDSSVNLPKQAINAALAYRWEEAVLLNKKIIKQSPNDVDTLNRLAKALFELGKYPQSKKFYQSVLKLDPYNVIAQKNLKKLSGFKKGTVLNHTNNHPLLSPSLFLEEAGITKVITLIKLAEPLKLSCLSPGEEVSMVVKNRGVCVTDQNGGYLGVLPDDLSHLLIRLLRGGNKYSSFVKSVRPNHLSILIRETFRSKRFKNQPSFISDSQLTYSSDHITLSSDGEESSEDPDETQDTEERFPS